jgi:transcriptional regulator with XRE-family HTH domain
MNGREYKAARKARGLTQAELAARVGLDPQTISRRERSELPITKEAELAVLSLPKKRKRPRPQNA